ncbi:MAG: FprA family A-type flavoprotein [Eubacterium sp.]|nr:FprA family A-type flavoprotein [Eubacterium sp.]
MENKVTDSIRYIGVDDKDLDLFESQYEVPNGMAYNSYLILDEKIAIMDTVDERGVDAWVENLQRELAGRTPDYVVVQHMEPDHSGSLMRLLELYPDIKLVGNAKTFQMLPQFYFVELGDKAVTVKEGDTLSLGSHTLQFLLAPMVHWPEVMMTYEQSEKVFFAADAFGKFGTLDTDEDWACEARRYYFNIVGKYGAPVQMLLKKAAQLDIRVIAPLHGPILSEDLGYYIGLYDTWSSYTAESKGVFIAVASIHGNTLAAARKLEALLLEKGEERVVVSEISREDMAEIVEDAFRHDRMVLAASSYDGGVFLPMHDLLTHLSYKGFQNRKVGILENGSWAPSAARTIKGLLEPMKGVEVLEPVVTIRSTLKDADLPQLEALADALIEAGK